MYGNQFICALDGPDEVLDVFELHHDYVLGGSFHGNRYIYLINYAGTRWRVSVRRVSELLCVVEGARWNDFAMHNITCSDVAYLHFIEEGEDMFYVATYNEYGEELHSYEPVHDQFWRVMLDVTDTSHLVQPMPEEFLAYLNGPTATDSVMVTSNTTDYQVELEVTQDLYDRYVHTALWGCGWEKLAQDLNMTPGQKMVFTQVVPGSKYNVMLFSHAGGAITRVETYSTNISMNALCHQPYDYDFEAPRMNWMCNWEHHTVHDQEERAFYRKMTASFWNDGRLLIPSRIVNKYNLYGFCRAVVKHKNIEKEFAVRERTIEVGQWQGSRQVAIVSLNSFRQLMAEAHFGLFSMVRFFLGEETDRSQRVLHFDLC